MTCTVAVRCAKAVASTGTRAIAPPKTRSWIIDIGGATASASTMAFTDASSIDFWWEIASMNALRPPFTFRR